MRHVGRRYGAGDRGAGTALVVGLVAVVAVIILGVAVLGAATVAHAQAQSAADLAALGAARSLAESRVGLDVADACATARSLAQANGSTVQSCQADSAAGIVAVVVTRDVAGVGQATAHARAGPAPPGGR